MYNLRKNMNTWINLHSRSLLKKRSQKHKTGLKCTAQDLPYKDMFNPLRNQPRGRERSDKASVWPLEETRTAFLLLCREFCTLSLNYTGSLMSIDPHITLTLLKTITVNF